MVTVVCLKNNNYKGKASAESVHGPFVRLRPLKGLLQVVSGVTWEEGAEWLISNCEENLDPGLVVTGKSGEEKEGEA